MPSSMVDEAELEAKPSPVPFLLDADICWMTWFPATQQVVCTRLFRLRGCWTPESASSLPQPPQFDAHPRVLNVRVWDGRHERMNVAGLKLESTGIVRDMTTPVWGPRQNAKPSAGFAASVSSSAGKSRSSVPPQVPKVADDKSVLGRLLSGLDCTSWQLGTSHPPPVVSAPAAKI